MKLETDRLILYPLIIQELEQWCEDLPAFEKELGCSYQAEPMTGFFQEVVRDQVAAAKRDQANYLYYTFWLILRREGLVVVGSASIKAPPNDRGEVEIGYGLGKSHEGNGYMAEAVRALCSWVMEQEMVRAVVAETDRDGYHSHAVLERCGFRKIRTDQSVWWRLAEKYTHVE